MRSSRPLDLSTLNPGIRETVAWVRSLGFDTCDSGDGKTHEHACDREHAYVVAVTDPDVLCMEAERLRRCITALGIDVGPIGGDLPCIQASYDPETGYALIEPRGEVSP